jgi:pimeloyl-ACP methyl ester carboxylesterase
MTSPAISPPSSGRSASKDPSSPGIHGAPASLSASPRTTPKRGFVERSSSQSWEQAEAMMRPPEINGVPVETFVGFMKRWPDIAPIWSEQLSEMVLSNLEVRDGKVYRRLPIPDHMKIAREIWEQDTSLLWERVRCPVLMVPALKDSSDPRSQLWTKAKLQGIETAKRKLKDSTVVPMEDTIHDIPVQRPKELAEAIIAFAAVT